MQNNFRAVTISHKTAPIEIRELMALGNDQISHLLSYFKEFGNISEALILSTCNRTEVYYQSGENKSAEIIRLIGMENDVDNIGQYEKYFIDLDDHHQTVQHLFNVAIGLEAQVVGDLQISNQVKRAYQSSADAGLAGPFLHRLMHTIFFTNKKVIQETSFRDGAASVSYVTAEMVKDLGAEIINPTVLVLGLGEIGEDVCRNLMDAGFEHIYITNRTAHKAEKLAAECGFGTIPFNEAVSKLNQADVIISSIAKEEPFITAQMVENLNILGYKYFFDLSVPRSIEDEVDNVAGALLYNIDDIKSKANAALEKRIKAIPRVKEIIKESIAEFSTWSNEMVVSPTINKLKGALEEIRKEEIARFLKGTDLKQAKMVEKLTKSMMQKIIKLPVLQLKAACKRGEAETLIDVLNDLFDLEKSASNKER
ncbi:glutamyl-tRNA reductase [Fulvivirgaceae bacterium BMA12]|uniref:Glutamyl-tRNA reductase n=1 Tax=Agaribacillus aureus TaxID=3051825 RepID=A0ABT8LF42_9BACT|nr:glutamyl-tRNA reductase [Fulvivirgaceae bacterium BMA12]